jgi:NAD(P)-dependent dehydrogenase (short-subunit alcohol dehydrogenase family)
MHHSVEPGAEARSSVSWSECANIQFSGEAIVSMSTAVVIGVGAERGLGAALCRRFAAEAYHVLVAGRTASKIEQVVRTIVAAGGSAEPIATDTTSEQDIVRLFDRAMTPGAGRAAANLVVYNAGNNRRMEFLETSAGSWPGARRRAASSLWGEAH